jgi:hypothetical protein
MSLRGLAFFAWVRILYLSLYSWKEAELMHPEFAATAIPMPAKRVRRKRLPAPKFRTPLASIRRFNDLVTQFTREVGRELLAGEREMVRQAAAIMLRAEQLQAGLVKGEPVNPDELIRLSSEARRALRTIKASVKKPGALPTPLPWSPLRSALAKAAAIGRGEI